MTTLTPDDKRAIGIVAEGMGGLEKFTQWAKNNPTEFYTQFYKQIIGTHVGARVDAQAQHDGDRQGAETLIRSLVGVLSARRHELLHGEDGVAEPCDNASHLQISESEAADQGSAHSGPGTDRKEPARSLEENSDLPVQKNEIPAPEKRETKSTAKKATTVRIAPASSIPGACAAQALEGLDSGKSTTQLFYEWSGHGRWP